MEGIDYKALYELQDNVLEIVFNTEREFYLTENLVTLGRKNLENINYF